MTSDEFRALVHSVASQLRPKIVGRGEFTISKEHARQHLAKLHEQPPSPERDERIAYLESVLREEP